MNFSIIRRSFIENDKIKKIKSWIWKNINLAKSSFFDN